MRRALELKRESLTELTGEDLAAVVGGTTMTTVVLVAVITRYVDSTPTLDDNCL